VVSTSGSGSARLRRDDLEQQAVVPVVAQMAPASAAPPWSNVAVTPLVCWSMRLTPGVQESP
jgi:hypothetical protein